MNSEQTLQAMLQDIATIKADLASANKKIEKNESRTDHIHRLAANLENLTEQIKIQNVRWEKMFESLGSRIKEQTNRIAQIEKKELEIEKELLEKGAKRWDSIFISVCSAIVIAVVFYFLSQLGL